MNQNNSREVEEVWSQELRQMIGEVVITMGTEKGEKLVAEIKGKVHQELQKARESERKIIKLRIDYDRRKGIPAEETVNDIYDSIELKDQSKLDQPNT